MRTKYDYFLPPTIIEEKRWRVGFSQVFREFHRDVFYDLQELRSDVDSIIDKVYPVGSIYISTNPTNPSQLFGVGTWVAFGAGRVLVGIDPSQPEFDTVEETGGEKTHTLTTAEMPSHGHEVKGGSLGLPFAVTTTGSDDPNAYGFADDLRASDGAYFSAQNTGGGQPHNNLQPYIVVYMWKRTA